MKSKCKRIIVSILAIALFMGMAGCENNQPEETSVYLNYSTGTQICFSMTSNAMMWRNIKSMLG